MSRGGQTASANRGGNKAEIRRKQWRRLTFPLHRRSVVTRLNILLRRTQSGRGSLLWLHFDISNAKKYISECLLARAAGQLAHKVRIIGRLGISRYSEIRLLNFVVFLNPKFYHRKLLRTLLGKLSPHKNQSNFFLSPKPPTS